MSSFFTVVCGIFFVIGPTFFMKMSYLLFKNFMFVSCLIPGLEKTHEFQSYNFHYFMQIHIDNLPFDNRPVNFQTAAVLVFWWDLKISKNIPQF